MPTVLHAEQDLDENGDRRHQRLKKERTERKEARKNNNKKKTGNV